MNHTVHIEKIVHGGHGLSRLDSGIVTMTPGVIPGERVLVREAQKQRGYIVTEPVTILEPSPDRIEPPCPLYSQCGGCDMQHMRITTQHQAKEDILQESLQRAGVAVDNNTIHPIESSPDEFHYRYRIRLKISPDGIIGFYKSQSNEIVEIASCPVATEHINETLHELREKGFIDKISAEIFEIELLHSPSDNTIFCLLHIRRGTSLPQEMLNHLQSFNSINAVAIKEGKKVRILDSDNTVKSLSQNFDETICGHPYSLSWTPGCFSQVNAQQNTKLVRLACQLPGEVSGQQVLDLYCGMGNFSIPLGLQGAEVTGVERNTECIEQANENAKRLELTNVHFVDNDVQNWLRKSAKRSKKYDTIILDPPRQGIGKIIHHVFDLSPSKIVYISCDPATLARDIAIILKQGFKLTSVTPVDMFPQTHHIESVALLEKN